MQIRDRIKEFRRMPAKLLRPNPRNWRMHPQEQRDALCGVLAEVGYADALIARELADGSFELIDGHLRAETTPDQEVPVLVLDLSEEEAAKLLAVLDPLCGMAETDEKAFANLISEIETENNAVRSMLDQMLSGGETLEQEEATFDPEEGEAPAEPADVPIPEAYQVIVECRDERQQQETYERLTAEGLKCRLMTL